MLDLDLYKNWLVLEILGHLTLLLESLMKKLHM